MMTHQGRPTRFGSARSFRFRPHLSSYNHYPETGEVIHRTYQAPFILEFPRNSCSTEISSDFVADSDVSAPGIPSFSFRVVVSYTLKASERIFYGNPSRINFSHGKALSDILAHMQGGRAFPPYLPSILMFQARLQPENTVAKACKFLGALFC